MNNYGKVGGLFDTIFNAAMQVAPLFVQQANAGAASGGQAKGYAAIKAFCERVLAGLREIKSQIEQLPANQRANAAPLIGQAQEIAATLGNSAYVYQAKNGDDARVLRDSKAQAAVLIAEIQNLISSPAPATTNTPVTSNPNIPTPVNMPVTLPNGQIVYVQTPAPATSVNNDLLLYAGIGLALLFVLRK